MGEAEGHEVYLKSIQVGPRAIRITLGQGPKLSATYVSTQNTHELEIECPSGL